MITCKDHKIKLFIFKQLNGTVVDSRGVECQMTMTCNE